MTMKKKIEGY